MLLDDAQNPQLFQVGIDRRRMKMQLCGKLTYSDTAPCGAGHRFIVT
jgi:hypothetical protein